MVDITLNGLRVAILATDDFEQVELTGPKKALDQAGAYTKIVSPEPKNGQVVGFNHDIKGDTFKVDLPLEQANAADFDAVLLPGGALNADKLRVNQQAQDFVRQIDQAGKPIAVICHAPWLLVSAGLVRGRKLTSYHTIQDDVRNAGGQWEDSQVVQDRNWVSSRQPDDIPAFNQAMLNLFSKGVYSTGSQNSAETFAPEGAYTSESQLGNQSTPQMTDATGHEGNLRGEDDVRIHGRQA
jgi:protease I